MSSASAFIGLHRHGLPKDFLTALEADLTALDQTVHEQSSGRDAHVAAGAAISKSTRAGMDIARAFGVIVRNQLEDDSVELARWDSARHIEKARHEDVKPSPTPSPAPAPASRTKAA